ncbi:MAG: hypothetical protein RLZZ568_292, partial [Cyanobacteriota bacterium]
MKVQINWNDPIAAEPTTQILALPVAFGREIDALPTDLEGQPVTPFQLLDANKKISRYHALLNMVEGQLIIEDFSTNGTLVDGVRIQRVQHDLASGSIIGIGHYDLMIVLENKTVLAQSDETVLEEPNDSDGTIINPINPSDLADNPKLSPSTHIMALEWTEKGQLHYREIDFYGTKVPGLIRIGRDEDQCDLVLPQSDKTVSRLHLEIFSVEPSGDSNILHDFPGGDRTFLRNVTRDNPPDKRNPVIVDGQIILEQEVPINAGSHIQIGESSIIIKSIDAVLPNYPIE